MSFRKLVGKLLPFGGPLWKKSSRWSLAWTKSGEPRNVPAHNLILGWRSCRDASPSLHVSECSSDMNVPFSYARFPDMSFFC